MTTTRAHLTVLTPEPIDDERTALLNASDEGERDDVAGLEAQARREQREIQDHDIPIADEPSTKMLLVTMSGLWLSTFFAALDATVVATLSGPISASLESGTLFSWIASGYLIANAAFQPLSGKLTDIYGRRSGLVFAIVFFAAGTLLCGFARQGWTMVVGRIIAGSGGGCLNTVSTFIASDLVPLRKRGVWQGYEDGRPEHPFCQW